MNLQTLIYLILAIIALAAIIAYAVKRIIDELNLGESIPDLLGGEYWYIFVILGIALLLLFVYVLLTHPAWVGMG
jgi:hypothetical protein